LAVALPHRLSDRDNTTEDRRDEMKVIAFNGSPRQSHNTATLLGKALDGAASVGAETDLVHLYTMQFKGCSSCFACKIRNGRSYGTCAVRDDLTPLLNKITEADAILLGSPIYFASVSGEMKSFLERLMFPYLVYDKVYSSLFPKKIKTAFIYTMNVSEAAMGERGYLPHLENNERFLARLFGASERLCSFDTYQTDYTKIVADGFDPEKKAERRRDVFPQDCENAFQLGVRLARQDALAG